MSDDEESSSEKPETTSESGEEEEPPKLVTYAAYQIIVFIIIYTCYCLALYTRKGFVNLLPYVILDRFFTSESIDMILTTQQISYMIGKIIFGCVVDEFGATKMFGCGLALAGFFTCVFPDLSDPFVLNMVSVVNGLAHACIWPAVVKIMRAWYPYQQFGLAFNLMFTSANFISVCGPQLASSLASMIGWRLALSLPAMLMMVVSPVAYLSFRDNPSDVGYQDSKTTNQHLQGHYSDLLASEFFLIHMGIYIIMFTIKGTLETYGPPYLYEMGGFNESDLSNLMLIFEVGGVFGSFIWGLITDNMQAKRYYRDANKSIRIIMAAGSSTGLVIFLYLFNFNINALSDIANIRVIMFMLGFFLYATIMLVYLNAIAFSHIHIAGFAYSLMSCCANLGTFTGNVVTEWAVTDLDWTWRDMYGFLLFLSLLSFVVLTTYKEMENTFFIETVGKRLSEADVKKGEKSSSGDSGEDESSET